jgi:large subunit ribosomal protein L29
MASEVVKAKDLRGRSTEELASFIREKAEELFKLRFQHFTGQLENVARLKHVRREIARARTIQGEKQKVKS